MASTPHYERDRVYHQSIADEYHQLVVEPRGFANDMLFAGVMPLVSRRECYLDLGCGTGHGLLRFAPMFKTSVGVDHSEGMLSDARGNLKAAGLNSVELVTADLLEWLSQPRAERFELISLIGVLHHASLDDVAHILRGAREHLSDGGVLVVAEPLQFDPSQEPKAIQWWNRRSLGARAAYSHAAEDPDEAPLALLTLHAAFDQAGLELVRLSRMWEVLQWNPRPRWWEKLAMRALAKLNQAEGVVGGFVLQAKGAKRG